ncbi:MAG: hypothetical protein FWE78_04415 [Methanimicrococcus sp.]|nr:hypothetical protein [Methanimicrococcus sp.]
MKDLETFVLHREKTDRHSATVWAEIVDGSLRISGQALGEAPLEVFGEDEYEYFYTFDERNTEKLFGLLMKNRTDVKELLTGEFGGTDGDKKLRDFCEKNEIKYEFFSYY